MARTSKEPSQSTRTQRGSGMHASPTHAATASSLLRAQARPMRARASTWLLRASSRTPTQAPAHERAQHAWTRTRAWRRTVPCVRRSCARMASASYAFMQTLRQPNSGTLSCAQTLVRLCKYIWTNACALGAYAGRREPRQSLLGPTRVRVVRAGRASRSRTGAQVGTSRCAAHLRHARSVRICLLDVDGTRLS